MYVHMSVTQRHLHTVLSQENMVTVFWNWSSLQNNRPATDKNIEQGIKSLVKVSKYFIYIL